MSWRLNLDQGEDSEKSERSGSSHPRETEWNPGLGEKGVFGIG